MDDIKFRQIKYALILIIILIVFLFVALDSIGFIKIFNFDEEKETEIKDWSIYSSLERLEAGEANDNFIFISGDELEEEFEEIEDYSGEIVEELPEEQEDASGDVLEDISGEISNS